MATFYGKINSEISLNVGKIDTTGFDQALEILGAKVNDAITQELTHTFYTNNLHKPISPQVAILPTPPPHREGTIRLFVLSETGVPVSAGLLGTHREPWEKWMSLAYDRIILKTTILLGYRVRTLFNGCDPCQIQKYGTNFCPQEELNLFKVVVQRGNNETQEFWFTHADDALDFHKRVVRILNE